MPQDGHARQLRHDLSEQLQALGDQLGPEKGCPRDIATWTRKAGNQAVLDRIGHAGCDDGNEAGGLLSWMGGGRTQRDNDIKLAFNHFRGEFAELIRVRFPKPALDDDILSFCVAELAQPFDQSVESRSARVGSFGAGR